MSVASEFAPEVFIPERARPAVRPVRPRHLSAVPAQWAPLDLDEELATDALLYADPCLDALASERDSYRAARSAVRLTARGRLVVLTAVALIGAFMLLVAHQSAPATPKAPVVSAVVVEPGDTLWSIAQQVAPNQDPRRVVHDIEERNGLSGATALSPGQTLKIS
ncbi:MAG: hypothetical protein JWN95_3475 [Frankiales bacterium]|nr:hypothetical protein [Frankiales bacterium]